MVPPVVMSGGVAKNVGVVRVLEKLLETEIVLPSEPQIVGALGAALFAMDELKSKV
jgi:activator of 2-hydroxyglutaryl-CoA dehydratase